MPPTLTRSTILKWALTSRILTVAWCVVSDLVLPDHAATDVERWQADQDAVLPAWLTRPFREWDAAHLLRVARVGYVTDRDAAFFPLYPCLVHYVTKLLPFLAEAERYVVAGTLLSNMFFVGAVSSPTTRPSSSARPSRTGPPWRCARRRRACFAAFPTRSRWPRSWALAASPY